MLIFICSSYVSKKNAFKMKKINYKIIKNKGHFYFKIRNKVILWVILSDIKSMWNIPNRYEVAIIKKSCGFRYKGYFTWFAPWLQCTSEHKRQVFVLLICESLWIKASAKWFNVNVLWHLDLHTNSSAESVTEGWFYEVARKQDSRKCTE